MQGCFPTSAKLIRVKAKNKPCIRRTGYMRLIPWTHPRGSETQMTVWAFNNVLGYSDHSLYPSMARVQMDGNAKFSINQNLSV
jgi:hypothetical protein